MRLETSRLILRDYGHADWERVHIYGSDPDFSKYEAWGPNTVQDTKDFVALMVEDARSVNRWKFDLAVCLKEGELLIGGCGIRRDDAKSDKANLGWAINPQFQGKGYATEAASALIDFGFETLGLSLIYATCDSRNLASARVMEKLGMKFKAHRVADKMQKGHLRDTYLFELTPDTADSV